MALEIANTDAPEVCKAFPDLEDSKEQQSDDSKNSCHHRQFAVLGVGPSSVVR